MIFDITKVLYNTEIKVAESTFVVVEKQEFKHVCLMVNP
jgi:hypothetical protein